MAAVAKLIQRRHLIDKAKANKALVERRPVPKAVLRRLNIEGDWTHGILLVDQGHAIDPWRGKDPSLPLRGLTILHTVRNVLRSPAFGGLVDD